MYKTLLTSLESGIFIVTVNRPDKLNALNKDVMSDLDAVMNEIENNSDIKAVILTGAGQKAFVAGADISEFVGLSNEEGKALAKRGQDIFFRIENCTKPIVAAVNGFALGGGCELAMACHSEWQATMQNLVSPKLILD
jgi:enoyl-CoA hydratase